MNNANKTIDGKKLFKGASLSISYALKISIPVILTLLIIQTFTGSFPTPIYSLIPLFFMWMMSVAMVTLFFALFIGVPVTIILIKSGLDDVWILAFIGAFIIFYMILMSVGFTASALMYTFYGFVCAYAFMKGYKKS